MSDTKTKLCQNFYTGRTDEEIITAFNQKWLSIIKNNANKELQERQKSDLQKSDNHAIINSTANQFCSANLEERGAEQ